MPEADGSRDHGATPTAPKRSWVRAHFLLAMLSASVALNLGLAIQLNHARAALNPPSFLSGSLTPTIQLHREGGNETKLIYGQGTLPTLLCWFSPSCGWCEANFENFTALATQASDRYRFVAVSSATPLEIGEYSSRHHVNFPLYSIDEKTANEYRLSGTPATLLISPKGVLIKKWVGAFSPSLLVDIERVLHLKLPGLPSQASSGQRER